MRAAAFFIIWNPKSNLPPRVRFSAFNDAVKAAESLTRRFPTDTFFVCEARTFVAVAPTPVKVIELSKPKRVRR